MMMSIWHHRQTWHTFISAVYHTECLPYTTNIADIYNIGFLTPNFKATVISTFVVHLLWKFTKWLKYVEKMLCAVLWNFCVQFWNCVPLKVVPLFLDHPIYPKPFAGISFLWSILYVEASIELFYWSGLKPDYMILLWQKRKTQIESSWQKQFVRRW